ncbi:PEP-CTERM sorting domain-containing protein [Colwellia sp. MB3u-70]|uniref:PEP-CTERM sorting domain-containing protein n=1 Tax=unclassified Colwellia TaxID=196834 RepID=UPI0015F58242|nr:MULTISPECIES: PEP-CTERM sorting domain-containing protein [unclassified Colwellia]MBA6291240.1 PEP-CTERM sorting domain-containing protein [Colwellia sp. MB3u-8]MBA6307344.1 PEP-CTERM sorting domain-containing protein [Colwellia sp. MB3u-70]
MKFKFLKQLVLGFALVVSANTTAGIISSTDGHSTSDGSVVNLSGLDWLSWDVTTGQSRTSVENGFGGLLDDGWRYASVMEYKTMMESVFDTYTGWSSDNVDGAEWLYGNLYGHTEVNSHNFLQYNNFYGDDLACTNSPLDSCYGHFRFNSYTGDLAAMSRGWSNANHNSGEYGISKSRDGRYASVLVRATSVPGPSTLAIFALGMIGFASRRFKKQP